MPIWHKLFLSSYSNLLGFARYFKISIFLDPSQNQGVVKYIGLDGNSDGTISGTKYKNNQARLDIFSFSGFSGFSEHNYLN